ncbi:coiled-coil domain-containing protein 42 [Bacillus rossius redtenbacheri]|uniref:coiled-coil domain-containing protein 42 n=1 Tax=Bacillus rossius redtenbacheri TaxID=93214 RepID=UPI002FDEB0F4
MKDKKNEEIESMKVTISKLEETRELMEQRVKDYHIYEDFLNKVVAHTQPHAKDTSSGSHQSMVVPRLESINDVIHRYETFIAARDDLLERQRHAMESLERERKAMAQLEQEKIQTLIGLNNELATLHVRYDQALANTVSWEGALARITQTGSEKISELGQVRAATWSMYQEVCRQRGEPVSVAESNAEAQLAAIKEFLQLTEQIVALCAHKHQRQLAT